MVQFTKGLKLHGGNNSGQFWSKSRNKIYRNKVNLRRLNCQKSISCHDYHVLCSKYSKNIPY